MGRGEYWRLVDSQGRPPGLLGMWPSRAVTFIENHDTGTSALAALMQIEAHGVSVVPNSRVYSVSFQTTDSVSVRCAQAVGWQ